jgi:hypothetical protein
MSSKYIRIFEQPESNKAEASGDMEAVAANAVNNDVEGICPKCSAAMTVARIAIGSVHWCNSCRTATPMTEG